MFSRAPGGGHALRPTLRHHSRSGPSPPPCCRVSRATAAPQARARVAQPPARPAFPRISRPPLPLSSSATCRTYCLVSEVGLFLNFLHKHVHAYTFTCTSTVYLVCGDNFSRFFGVPVVTRYFCGHNSKQKKSLKS